ncbi:MAG TPA: dihydrofolate reductase family protein [Pseudonocardiaceae bacterium]|jgi:dihydrofolate reductase|nr:dihydrofolate reductase family protein [Pseudonocardiaceae bacterium]
MRKIVNSTYMTLDGDITNMADWHFEFFGEEAMRTARDLLWQADSLIMGRKTYDGMASAWLSRAGNDDFADRMNELPKHVLSNTLTDPTWNSEVINGDVVSRLRALKEQDGGPIVQYGFGPVTRLLLENDLLDELVIWLHPVLSGKAQPDELIYRDMAQQKFTLANVDVHSTGIAVLTYQPARS